MKFDLDSDGRFQLSSTRGGWDLVVDGKIVFYCHTPVEAVKYMTEELGCDSVAEGVRDVVDALAGIKEEAERAVEVINFAAVASDVAKMLNSFSPDDDHKTQVLKASLCLADCTEAELRVREDRHVIVNKAKAVLGARG